jgi:hypothetical protein
VSNVKDTLDRFGALVVERAKKELNALKPRKVYRAKWKRGRLKSFQIKIKQQRADSSGALKNSLQYDVVDTTNGATLVIDSLDYGVYLQEGRLPGRGIPPRAMAQYIREKKIRPQDTVNGGFLKKTPQNLKAMAFMMNRKIKYFGIEPNPFMNEAIAFAQPKLAEELSEAYAKDIADQLRDSYGI